MSECVYVRERERERERDGDCVRDSESVCERVSVQMFELLNSIGRNGVISMTHSE